MIKERSVIGGSDMKLRHLATNQLKARGPWKSEKIVAQEEKGKKQEGRNGSEKWLKAYHVWK